MTDLLSKIQELKEKITEGPWEPVFVSGVCIGVGYVFSNEDGMKPCLEGLTKGG